MLEEDRERDSQVCEGFSATGSEGYKERGLGF